MTNKAPKNYSQGKIYKIEPICDPEEGDIYIGSTTKDYLSQRMVQHKSNYKRWKNETDTKFITNFKLFDKYGVDNFQIVLLESVDANDYNELVAKEASYIRNLKCVNKVIPNRTYSEYKEENKEKIREKKKEYYDNNRNKISDKQKIWYVNNIENVKQKYDDNKPEILIAHKQYRDSNKKKIKEYEILKFNCECGSLCVRKQKERHYRTEKHQLYLKSLQT